ncbi:hypothetical protein RGU12_01630 [Fredinandcohnia sp. QZ13]|uniref:hypothetical protein n=1 Tax=Fredinandcohnia sp. QZ13 TaxID=3073144 RepID=UPI002853441D|nr:hypothetical protein [Fredinandcohnia sp. QZ13]MDR4886246.1 hypothetical protein [Fredinandcohnia sp. QZ13]
MVDINEHKREDNNTSYAEETGDTIASALDPFGSNAGPIAGGAGNNKSGKDLIDDDKQDSKTRA